MMVVQELCIRKKHRQKFIGALQFNLLVFSLLLMQLLFLCQFIRWLCRHRKVEDNVVRSCFYGNVCTTRFHHTVGFVVTVVDSLIIVLAEFDFSVHQFNAVQCPNSLITKIRRKFRIRAIPAIWCATSHNSPYFERNNRVFQ